MESLFNEKDTVEHASLTGLSEGQVMPRGRAPAPVGDAAAAQRGQPGHPSGPQLTRGHKQDPTWAILQSWRQKLESGLWAADLRTGSWVHSPPQFAQPSAAAFVSLLA